MDKQKDKILKALPGLFNANKAQISKEKIFGYVLCKDHIPGGDKAKMFAALGFEIRNKGQMDSLFQNSGNILIQKIKGS